MQQKVNECTLEILSSGRGRYKWRLGVGAQTQSDGVCRSCFMACYRIGETFLLELVGNMKSGGSGPEHQPFGDKTKVDPPLVAGIKS